MFDYEKYGDSPTCLNDKFDISNQKATIQGFGLTDGNKGNEEENKLGEAKVLTVSNEDCIKWVQANSKELEPADGAPPYGNGTTFGELPEAINRQILCSKGIEFENGVISVSIYYYYYY